MLLPLRNRRRRVPRDGWKGPNRRSVSVETKSVTPVISMPEVDSRDFNKHLDACPQCANNPFALCSEGNRLLYAAVK